jgi:hypothetical protein
LSADQTVLWQIREECDDIQELRFLFHYADLDCT